VTVAAAKLEALQRAFDRGVRASRAAWNRAGVPGVAMLAMRSPLAPRKLLFAHEVDVLRLIAMNGPTLPPLNDAYEFATADAAVLDDLVECTQAPGAIEVRRQTLARVLELCSCCITLRHHGRVVAYFCAFERSFVLTYDDYGPKTLRFAFDEGAVFLGNAFVRPEYRMRGLFPRLVGECIERFPPGTRFFGHIDCDNVHSFNSHRRLGFVPLLTVTCVALGPTHFFFQRPFGARKLARIQGAGPLELVEREDGIRLAIGA
jgi:hypothetical protein